MSNLTRKSFIASLAATTLATSLEATSTPPFRDINPSLHYKYYPFVSDLPHDIPGYVFIDFIKWNYPEELCARLFTKPTPYSFQLKEIETGDILTIDISWIRDFYRYHKPFTREESLKFSKSLRYMVS